MSDRRLTLPPIRDVFRDELSSTPQQPTSGNHASHVGDFYRQTSDDIEAEPRRRGYDNTHMHAHRRRPSEHMSRGHAADVHAASGSPSPPIHSQLTDFSHPNWPNREVDRARYLPISEQTRRSSAPATSAGLWPHADDPRAKSQSFSGSLSNQTGPGVMYDTRTSNDGARVTPSPARYAMPAPTQQQPSSSLHFQSLPLGSFGSSGSPPMLPQRLSSSNTNPVDYQSPFGVLVIENNPSDTSQDASGSSSSAKYECEYCFKRFNRPSSLRIHINTHTGEKPFQCPHQGCGRSFSVHSNMRRHTRIHASLTPTQESSGDELDDDSSNKGTPSPLLRHSEVPMAQGSHVRGSTSPDATVARLSDLHFSGGKPRQ